MDIHNDLMTPREWQPAPVANDTTPIFEMVIADIRRRAEQGRKKYGVALQAFNGRNALQDAYEEVLDLAHYVKQEMAERDALAAQNVEMRVALEMWAKWAVAESPITFEEKELERTQFCDCHLATTAALSLPLPAAAERVKAEREFCEAYSAFEISGSDAKGRDAQLRWLKAKRRYHELVSNPYQLDGAARGAQ